MKYQLRYINPNTEQGWQDCIAVDKVLDPGESYLIATFRNVELAEACLTSLDQSLECATGATVSHELP